MTGKLAEEHFALMMLLVAVVWQLEFPTMQGGIVAEGAIALSVTLSGGVLCAK